MRCENKKYTTTLSGAFAFFILLVCFTVLHSCPQAFAEDWTTYMYNNSRGGVTSESLDLSQLRQAWVYTSPVPPRTAFSGPAPSDFSRDHAPLPATRDFDTAFFVTVVGDSVYFGSSVTNSVHCLNMSAWMMAGRGCFASHNTGSSPCGPTLLLRIVTMSFSRPMISSRLGEIDSLL